MGSQQNFEKLFSPGQIGTMKLRNRLVLAPMGTRTAEKAEVSDRMVNYYAERARGGTAMITTGSIYPYIAIQNRAWLGDDKCIPGLKRLADAVHAEGAKAALQAIPSRGTIDPERRVSPSGIPFPDPLDPTLTRRPKALSRDEIAGMIEEMADMALRARKAGFDAMQFHGAHGFLIAEFFSPLTNKRTDEYGGSLENRARFAVEIIRASKAKAGKDFPIIYRIMADERCEGGFPSAESVAVCRMLESAGADAIDVTSGSRKSTPEYMVPPMAIPHGYNVELARAIKKAVRIPVMVVGRINNPYLAEEILQQGAADFISIGRPLLADPEYPKKAMEGRAEDICPCIACLYCMARVAAANTPTRCAVNPVVAREVERRLRPAAKPKSVVVVGGGPGGMEAALIAAKRGHKVTLFEKRDKLGGQLLLASVPPQKEEIANYLEYLRKQIGKSGIRVKLNTAATVQSVIATNPDAVIIATGAVPVIPDIPGITGSNVFTALDVLSGRRGVGKNVVVIGGGLVGSETAHFLLEKGKSVTVLEIMDSIGRGIEPEYNRDFTVSTLKRAGARLETGITPVEITAKGVSGRRRDGTVAFFPAETVVLAAGLKPKRDLADELKGRVPEVYPLGDCVEPKTIAEAVEGGFEVAFNL